MARQPINVRLGQPFGTNPLTYARLGMKGHNGWDYPAPLGTPIFAPESGRIEQRNDPSGYGLNLYLYGDSGWQHVLGHQQRFAVGNGRVSEGQVVGYVNSTGFSTGHHLHWGTRPAHYNQGNGYYGYVDPQIFLNQQKGVSSLPYSDEQWANLQRAARQGRRVLIGQTYLLHLGRPPTDKEVDARQDQDPDFIVSDVKNSPEAKAYAEKQKALPKEPEDTRFQRLKDGLINFLQNFK